jgi:hypothetical protein
MYTASKPTRTWPAVVVAVIVMSMIGNAYNHWIRPESTPASQGKTTAMIARGPINGLSAEQFDQGTLDRLAYAMANEMNRKSNANAVAEGSFQQINGHRIGVVRLHIENYSPSISWVAIEGSEIVTVTCYSDHKITLQPSDPVCAEKVNEAFKPAALAAPAPLATPAPTVPDVTKVAATAAPIHMPSPQPSAFETRTLGSGISIAAPKDWRWMGTADASYLNTGSEAALDSIGVEAGQGNNTVLLAGNAFNNEKQSVATMRVSVRSSAEMSQDDMREGLKESTAVTNAVLRQGAEATAEALRKISGMSSYRAVDASLEQNASLICIKSTYEYDQGRGPTISNTWVCPLGDRTVKLSTSYHKAQSNLFAPTVDYMWRSLAVSGFTTSAPDVLQGADAASTAREGSLMSTDAEASPFLNFIIVLVILFLPPTIIRLAWRRPLSNKVAISILVLSYFPFHILFQVIKAQEYSNLIFLGVFASYWILRFQTSASAAEEMKGKRKELGYDE